MTPADISDENSNGNYDPNKTYDASYVTTSGSVIVVIRPKLII